MVVFEADQSKSAQAIFVEAATDITDSLELRGALRYESLEDDSTVDPKLSLRYQASDDVVIRASLSSSFREPTLAQLYASTVGLEGIQDFDTAGNPVGSATFIHCPQKLTQIFATRRSGKQTLGFKFWVPTIILKQN
ncbi:MAG: hypothetical protein CM15mP22_4200 [Gammaproteobacteria bacterium]|nr:MAG: hypothetical protein CM15mP22_4200 [Gammaproteobacteria bacterium]